MSPLDHDRPHLLQALPSPDPLAGTPYRALFPLAEGGMGELFEAEHLAIVHGRASLP